MTRKRFKVERNVSWDTLVTLPNVTSVTAFDQSPMGQSLRTIAYNVAVEHPDWSLSIRTDGFTMTCDGEELGVVSLRWSSRSEQYVPHLRCKRVSKYYNSDEAAVLRKIREVVYPMTVKERIQASEIMISAALYKIMHEAGDAAKAAQSELSEKALAFALSVENRDRFAATGADLAKVSECTDHAALMDSMYSHRALYILGIRVKDGWQIKFRNEYASYTQDELPDNMRNLRALQLMPTGMYITNIGVNVDGHVFMALENTQ